MKKILALLLAVLMIVSMAACKKGDDAGDKGGDGEKTKVSLKVWAPSEDQKDDGTGWLNVMLKKFEEAHPEYEITWELGVLSEGEAGNQIKSDPAAAADVYMLANDQIGTLVQAGALSKLAGKYLEQVKNDNTDLLLNSVTYSDGGVYGFPVTNNTWFMFYNNTVFNEEDVKSLEAMLAKGKVSFPLSNSWYGGTFFMSNGGTLFGEDNRDASAGIQFGGENGYAAAEAMIDFAANKNFANDVNGSGASGLISGDVGACFTGSWDYNKLKDALGDKLSVTQLPTAKIGGKDVQLKSFAGSKCVGVNPHCKNQVLAMQVAAFLASKDAQLERFNMRSVIPCHKELASDAAIMASEVAVAENNTMANCGVIQPLIPEMANYWSPMESFGNSIINGDTTKSNCKDQVDLMVGQLNKTGL